MDDLNPSCLVYNNQSTATAETNFSFFLEDTNERCYRDVSTHLDHLGWKRVPSYRKRSKLEKRRLPAKNLPLLLWTLNEKDIDFADLETFQMCNHFEGISKLTTKRGFCELLRDMHWIAHDAHEIAPRCYNLGDPLHREEFIEDFKITAVTNILKYVLRSAADGIDSSACVPSPMLKTCLAVGMRFLRIRRDGEWPGVERTLDCMENEVGQTNIYLTDSPEWQGILAASYVLAEQSSTKSHSAPREESQKWETFYRSVLKKQHVSSSCNNSLVLLRVWLVLHGLQAINRQIAIDGGKNIWVVKAPEACRGLGVKVLYKLEDILECERGMGGRCVQKYLENPLLAPLAMAGGATFQPNEPSPTRSPSRGSSKRIPGPQELTPMSSVAMTKFDLRVWVLVTSFGPLEAHVYSRVYGRRCGLPYDDNIKTLSESLIHLTNFSIQRKNQSIGDHATGSSTDRENGANQAASHGKLGDTNSVKRLRGACDSARPDTLGSRGVTQSDLLLPHGEILQVINGCGSEEGGRAGTWENRVWPEIKRKILATLEATKGDIVHRDRSFEFLGYDVIIDDQLTPWILEVNMSPAMSHRCASQSSLIAGMVKGLVSLAVLPFSGDGPENHEKDGFFADYCDAHNTRSAVEGPTRSSDLDTDSGGHIEGGWEMLTSPNAERSGNAKTRESRPSSCSTGIRVRPANEWVAAPSLNAFSAPRPRPKSASTTSRTSSGAGFSFASSNSSSKPSGNIDLSFAVVGRPVAIDSVEFHDAMCSSFGKVVLLQEWARRYLGRLRIYHLNRRTASILMQSIIRCYIAKCTRWHLNRAHAATLLQSHARGRAAQRHRIFLRNTRASTFIQKRVRIVLARIFVMKVRWDCACRRVQRWLRGILDVRRRKSAFKIVLVARCWLRWRRKKARIVYHLVAFHYRRRLRARIVIQMCTRSWILGRRKRELLRRNLADQAARKGREWSLRAMERRRTWDQAVHVKLEIIIYNEIYAMATEVAVEAYAEDTREAVEQAEVAAAATVEAALTIKAAEEAAHARSNSQHNFVARNYAELMTQLNTGAGAGALPYGSLAMRSPVECRDLLYGHNSEMSIGSCKYDECDDDLLGVHFLPDTNLPRVSPTKQKDLKTLLTMGSNFDRKSLALERDMQMQLLNLLPTATDIAQAESLPSGRRSAPKHGTRQAPDSQSSDQQDPVSIDSSPTKCASKLRPKSAILSKPSRFPRDVYGGSDRKGADSKRKVNDMMPPVAPMPSVPAAAKKASRKKKGSSKKHMPSFTATPWEEAVNAMNPYTFSGPPNPVSFQSQYQNDPEYHAYAASTTRIETERSILLTNMLNSLLEKHTDSRVFGRDSNSSSMQQFANNSKAKQRCNG